MKKSQAVPATLVTAVAAALMASGCNGSRRICVDGRGMARPDPECVANGGGVGSDPHWETRSTRGGRGYMPIFIPPMGRTNTSPAVTPGGTGNPYSGGARSAPARGGFGGSSGGSFGG